MRNAALILMALPALLGAPQLPAGAHVVARETLAERMAEAERQRGDDVATLSELLRTDAAVEAARALGADAGRLQSGLAALSSTELRQLAERAAALRGDPAAGLSSDVNTLLIIFLVVAIVILVLQAVD